MSLICTNINWRHLVIDVDLTVIMLLSQKVLLNLHKAKSSVHIYAVECMKLKTSISSLFRSLFNVSSACSGRSVVQQGGACPLLTVPNVTAHPSTASVPITVLLYDGPLLCGFNVAIKGLRYYSVCFPFNPNFSLLDTTWLMRLICAHCSVLSFQWFVKHFG